MDIKVQGAAETLDQGDNPGACAGAGPEPGPMGQIGLDGADDDGETVPERVRSAGEQQPEWPGKAQDPLANGYFRKNVVDEVR